jgi:two-component system sensor histidine kinase KdpD
VVEDELAVVDAIRRRVVNVVGHALRTPVTTLCGLAEEMTLAEDPAVRAELRDAVRRNGAIVERLLDDLLIAAGVSTALPVDETSLVELGDAVWSAWRTLEHSTELRVDGQRELTVLARRSAVERALALLLDNHAKYGDGPIDVRLALDGDRAVVTMSAPGELPSEVERPLLFELFYRGEHAVMRAAGLGIGLPVARALIEAEGGTVAVEIVDDRVVSRISLPASAGTT